MSVGAWDVKPLVGQMSGSGGTAQQTASVAPVSTPSPPLGAECVCQRPAGFILCARCGYNLNNKRVAKKCDAHPHRQNLMDLQMCPGCRGTRTLAEFAAK